MKQRDNKGHFIKTLDLRKLCEVCGKEYECRSLWKYQTSRYCSKECLGKHNSIIKKGIAPYLMTDEIKKTISKAKKGISIWGGSRPGMEWIIGENNNKWAGDKVGYSGVHSWIKRNVKLAGKCSLCGTIKKTKDGRRYTHLANISHEYKRDTNDYIELCPSCNLNYDYGHINKELLLKEVA